MSHPDLGFTNEYMSPLVGTRIVAAGGFLEDGETWPYFDVQLDGGLTYRIEVSRDTEGNGPGFLFGLPQVEGD